MSYQNKGFWYARGIRDGIPIALGYFTVAFTLGIAAQKAGLSVFQTGLAAALTNASAGAYAGFTMIAEGASYLEMAFSQLIINARYLLMSCALSQKLDEKTPLIHRILIAYDVTDEIFGISIAVPGSLCPFYNYGAMTVAIPAWAGGAALGALAGDILPIGITRALGVGLYGMFLAIIIPPARRSRIIALLVTVSMVLSLLFAKLPLLSALSSGTRIIVLTVILSLAAALIFPVKEEAESAA